MRNPRLVCFSPDVLKWIEVDEDETKRKDFADYFGGNKLLPGMRPAAHWSHRTANMKAQLPARIPCRCVWRQSHLATVRCFCVR